SVPAATTPAATAAAPERAGLPGGTDHRERRELPGDVGRGTLRARDLLIAPDKLLEMLLALHADVLVHRHRSGSLGPGPDAWGWTVPVGSLMAAGNPAATERSSELAGLRHDGLVRDPRSA